MRRKRFTRRDHVYKTPTVNADSFDKRRFNELLDISKGLQKVKHEGRNHPYFDQLMGDMWSSFFKNTPALLNKEEIGELIINYQIMEQLLNDESYQKAHEVTKLDDLHSTLNTIGFSDKVFKWLEEITDTDERTNEAYRNMKKQEREHGEGSKQHKEAMEQFMKALGEQMQNAGDKLSSMLKKTMEETEKTEENLKTLICGIKASSADSELKEVPLKDQFALAESLQHNFKMKKIAEWAGRFKAIARTKQKSISKEAMSRSGVSIGNDIDRILPSELINLANPAAKNDFLKRFAEGQTLQYATKGKQTLGKGPIILCLDQSGSMRKLDEQSKGFTLALMSIARHQKRDFALVTFANSANVKQYPKGKISTSQMVELCEHFLDGGTNFYHPLTQSLRLIKGSRFKNADIVFVTDGEASLANDFLRNFNEAKKKEGFSVLSLLIGNHAKESTVSSFSDEIYHARDFNDDTAQNVFAI